MSTKEKGGKKELSGLSTRFLEAIDMVGYTGFRLSKEMDELSSSILTHIRSGRNDPSTKIIIGFLEKFPFINARWLMTGEGRPKVEFTDNDLDGVSYSEILHGIPIEEIVAFLLNNEEEKAFGKNLTYRLFLEFHIQKKLAGKMSRLESKVDEILRSIR